MEEKNIGCETNVEIANDVVGKIAAIAALEIEGVAAMGNNITTELMGKVGMRNILKNVSVEVLNNALTIEVVVTVEYGYSIPATSQKVQARVKQAVENMTGLKVANVNVRVAGVHLNKEQ
ncbi:MAG: Asp23/Gls24 family envelope stress response protein [Lachnospiraceae bacterium]|nr:Asp23/Gls24 family envelope stress response protein [Lachnospiraceae bacterium]